MKIIITLITALLVTSVFVSKYTTAQNLNTDKQIISVALADKKPVQVRIYIEQIEISAFEYAELMTTPNNNNNHTELRNQLFEKAKTGKAKFISNHSIVTRNGEKATLESIQEYIYPTEYEPGEMLQPKPEDTAEQIAKFPVIPPLATAFETRYLGFIFEVEPRISNDGKIVDIRFAPESVTRLDDNVISEWKTPNSESKVAMPSMYTMRTNTDVTVKNGEFLLVNTQSPEKDGMPDHSRKLLQFLRAEVLTVGD